jgi:ferrochelatase
MTDSTVPLPSSPFSLPPSYDGILVVSFGGPEGPDDVLAFLENVARGRNIPRPRLLEVAEHYNLFGGVSPLNGEIRNLLTRLVALLNSQGPHLPVYWGNRNWHPMLADVVQQMADDGILHALAFVTSAFGSYSSCRQYREDIARAREEVGDCAPRIDVIRRFYNHPGFIETVADRVRAAFAELPEDRRNAASLVFTAHSIPLSMQNAALYEAQLREACRLVAEAVPHRSWKLAFQSRSVPPSQPWLGPDVESVIRATAAGISREIVISPIGFLNDHMEVVFDLDIEIHEICEELNLTMVRAKTPGSHPRFVAMIRELIL